MTKTNNGLGGLLGMMRKLDATAKLTAIETAKGDWREFLEICEEEGFRVSRDCGDVTISKFVDGVRVLGIRCRGGHDGPMVDGVTFAPLAIVEDRILTAAIHLGLEA